MPTQRIDAAHHPSYFLLGFSAALAPKFLHPNMLLGLILVLLAGLEGPGDSLKALEGLCASRWNQELLGVHLGIQGSILTSRARFEVEIDTIMVV